MKVVVDSQLKPSNSAMASSYWRKRNDKVITMDIRRANNVQGSPYRSTTARQNVFASQTDGSLLTPNRSKSPSQFYQPQSSHKPGSFDANISMHDMNELENLKKENQRLRQTVDTQQDRIKSLEHDLSRYSARDQEVDGLMGRYSDSSRRITNLEEELNQAQRTIRNLEFELEAKKKEIAERDREKTTIESTLSERERKARDLESREVEVKRELDEKKREADERKRKLQEMEDEKRRLILKIEELEASLKRQVTGLTHDKEKLEREIKELRERLVVIEKSNQEKELVLSRMFSQISDLNKTKSQIEGGSR